MKLLLPIALFVAAVAAADCEAESIVEACLESENKKFKACGDSDYGCQCAAQEAIATYVSPSPRRPLAVPTALVPSPSPYSLPHTHVQSRTAHPQRLANTAQAATTTAPKTPAASKQRAK